MDIHSNPNRKLPINAQLLFGKQYPPITKIILSQFKASIQNDIKDDDIINGPTD
uniref:Uncharacterized protein n=1 Tax=Nelumbo nucifera TaxID=4432 RepID=A0A822YBX4_NELNU|nr:TPA_asm: hypothetical protein HUJ06_010475 [Nelumbo nucifera]